MSEETQELQNEEEDLFEEIEEEEEEVKEEEVMCYISKRMTPLSQTVEVAYSADKTHRVAEEFIRY